MLAFWKRNGPQSSDYKRRFVEFFLAQRMLVGIVVLWIVCDITAVSAVNTERKSIKERKELIQLYVICLKHRLHQTNPMFYELHEMKHMCTFLHTFLFAVNLYLYIRTGDGTRIQTEWGEGRDHPWWARNSEAWPQRVDPTPTRKVRAEWPPQSSHPRHLPPSLQCHGVGLWGCNNKGECSQMVETVVWQWVCCRAQGNWCPYSYFSYFRWIWGFSNNDMQRSESVFPNKSCIRWFHWLVSLGGRCATGWNLC